MFDIKKFPSIIARPYNQAIKKDDQWKDQQRYTFENLMAYMACLAVSDLMNIYTIARESSTSESDDNSDSQLELIEKIRQIDSLKKVGLELMALGKWANILRETTRALLDYPELSLVPELQQIFHPLPGNKLWKDIDKLIKIRNEDAHGTPIQPDKLVKVLTERQLLLDSVLEQCSVITKYKVAIFESLVVDADEQVLMGKCFVNDGEESVTVKTELDPPMHELVLINETGSFYFKLRPLMLYASASDEESKEVALYSKQARKSGKVHYLGVSGAIDISVEEFDAKMGQDLGQQWKYLNEVFSEEDVLQPDLSGQLEASATMDIDDEDNCFHLILDNTDSTDLYNLRGHIRLPSQFTSVRPVESEDISFEYDAESSVLRFSTDCLEDGETAVLDVGFKATSQGGVRIPSVAIDYEYHRTESARETGNLTSEDCLLDGAFTEIRDPKSPDKIEPVINVGRRYLTVDSSPLSHLKIGDRFLFELSLSNIGLGAARDVSLELVFPDGFELIEGQQELKVNLNPLESRSFRYLVTTHTPGKYRVLVRPVAYKDFQGKRYLSSFTDDYSVLVRSDVIKQFEYEVAEDIADFTLDEDEIRQIERRKEQLTQIESFTDSVENIYQNALYGSSLKLIRGIISELAEKKNYITQESIVEETKYQTKVTKQNARQALVFSIKGVPFFAIDITQKENLIFHSLDSKILVRIHDFKYSSLFVDKKLFGYRLPLSLDYKSVLASRDLDISFFKKWISLCFKELEDKPFVLLKVKEKIEKELGVLPVYKGNGSYSVFIDPNSNDIAQQQMHAETGVKELWLMQQQNTGDVYLGFYAGSSSSAKFTAEYKDQLDGLCSLQWKPLKGQDIDIHTRSNDNNCIDHCWRKTDRINSHAAIEIRDTSDVGLQEGIKTFLKLIALNRFYVSKEILKTSPFSNKEYIDLLNDKLEGLIEAGFGLRRAVNVTSRAGINHKTAIEIYPFEGFDLGATTRSNCIGFLNSKKGALSDYYINFYKEVGDRDVAQRCQEYIDIYELWYRTISSNRVFLLSGEEGDRGLEKMTLFLLLIDKAVQEHSIGKKAIIPACLGEKMISAYVSYLDTANLVESLTIADRSKADVEKEYVDSKELQRIMRFNNICDKKHDWKLPIVEKGGLIGVHESYRHWLKELSAIEGGLASLKGVNPLVEYLQPLASTCEKFKNLTFHAHSSSFWGLWNLESNNNIRFKLSLKLHDDRIRAQIRFQIGEDRFKPIGEQLLSKLQNELGSYFSFEPLAKATVDEKEAIGIVVFKNHGDYDIMKNEEQAIELEKFLRSFFGTALDFLENEMKE